jgi:hypothetical protein
MLRRRSVEDRDFSRVGDFECKCRSENRHLGSDVRAKDEWLHKTSDVPSLHVILEISTSSSSGSPESNMIIIQQSCNHQYRQDYDTLNQKKKKIVFDTPAKDSRDLYTALAC